MCRFKRIKKRNIHILPNPAYQIRQYQHLEAPVCSFWNVSLPPIILNCILNTPLLFFMILLYVQVFLYICVLFFQLNIKLLRSTHYNALNCSFSFSLHNILLISCVVLIHDNPFDYQQAFRFFTCFCCSIYGCNEYFCTSSDHICKGFSRVFVQEYS